LCGSYPYLAPEIIASGRYTQAADVWSLGIVLYAMATAQFPFPASDVTALCQDIVMKPIEYPPNLSGGLIDLISKMLCRDCEERITVDQIRLHSWFPSEQYNAIVHAIACASPAVDREVIEGMELDGLDCAGLSGSLESGEESDMTVLYNVYLREKQGEWIKAVLNGSLKYSVRPMRPFRIIKCPSPQRRVQPGCAWESNTERKRATTPPTLWGMEQVMRKRRFTFCPLSKVEKKPALSEL
jgi:serine/threonine protein kinase